MTTAPRRRQRGVNLIELIIAIVVISIAATGVLLVYATAVRYSADPMVQQQALAVAEAYLDEILARPVADPRAGVTETGGAEAGESRATFNDVQDYAALSDSPPRNQLGSTDWDADGQPDLPGYVVDVAVLPNQAVNGVAMARIDVRVRYGGAVDFTLSGYRAN